MVIKAKEHLLETLWDNLSKSPDAQHITMTDEDLTILWEGGFVDTDVYSTQDWIKAFEPHKTPEGTYVLRKEDLLEKEKYRYIGEIMLPFDPYLINEGKYTDEGLQELIDMSIVPSCSLSRKEIQNFFDDFKERYRSKDALIVVDMKGKKEIAVIIFDHPSPRRRREILFEAMFIHQMEAANNAGIVTATPEQAAQVQTSAFTTLPSSQTEAAAKEFHGIIKSRAPKISPAGKEGIEVKKVKKSRKGIRG